VYTLVFEECITVHFAYSSIVTHMHYIQMLMGVINIVVVIIIIIIIISIIIGVLLQIYACPIYETMDTAWGRKQEGTWSIFNFSERFITRVIYLVLTTFVAALLPFFVSATLYIA